MRSRKEDEMKKLFRLIVVLVLCVMITACSSSAAGRYRMFMAKDSSGATYTAETTFGAEEVTLVLNKDGSAELIKSTDSVTASGSWDDTYLRIYDPYSGEELSGVYEVKNGELVWTISYYDSYYLRDSSMEIRFKK